MEEETDLEWLQSYVQYYIKMGNLPSGLSKYERRILSIYFMKIFLEDMRPIYEDVQAEHYLNVVSSYISYVVGFASGQEE